VKTTTMGLMGIALLLTGVFTVTEFAYADRGYPNHGHDYHGNNHSSYGVVIGVPFGFPGYYGYGGYGYPYRPYWAYPPYYPPYPVYAPGVVAVPSPPVTYIQNGGVQQGGADATSGWWYYCSAAQAYYPYVKECPGGWQRVAPQPQGQ
jgi:hypothetical protein